jgi:hypothetical protein
MNKVTVGGVEYIEMTPELWERFDADMPFMDSHGTCYASGCSLQGGIGGFVCQKSIYGFKGNTLIYGDVGFGGCPNPAGYPDCGNCPLLGKAWIEARLVD